MPSPVTYYAEQAMALVSSFFQAHTRTYCPFPFLENFGNMRPLNDGRVGDQK